MGLHYLFTAVSPYDPKIQHPNSCIPLTFKCFPLIALKVSENIVEDNENSNSSNENFVRTMRAAIIRRRDNDGANEDDYDESVRLIIENVDEDIMMF